MASLPDESTSLSTSIIKADRSGRSRYSQDYREEVLAAFDKSSLSGMDFARQCGIKYPTFASWVTKRKKASEKSQQPYSKSPFILAELQKPSVASEGLQIQFPSGATATMTSAGQAQLIAELIKALA